MAKNYEGRKENGEGNVRKLPSGKYECVVQSKYINPKTGKPKRIKRVGETEKAAREKAKLDLAAWEKEIERDRDTKINKAKNFGEYMSEYIETEVNPLSSAICCTSFFSYSSISGFYIPLVFHRPYHMVVDVTHASSIIY